MAKQAKNKLKDQQTHEQATLYANVDYIELRFETRWLAQQPKTNKRAAVAGLLMHHSIWL